MLYHTPTSIKANGKTLNDVSSSDYLAPDTNFFNNKNNNISLQLSGHTHAGQFIPWTWVADNVFKGFHYGLHNIGDDHYINISSGTGSWGPPLRSGHLSEIVLISGRNLFLAKAIWDVIPRVLRIFFAQITLSSAVPFFMYSVFCGYSGWYNIFL